MPSSSLDAAQTHALFDVLIHHQLYAEIEAFKDPATIDHYGYPFRKADGVQTTSPLLQNMLNKFVLPLPGLNSIGLDFWQDKIRTLVAKMAEAELSESYDKGSIGARKALATAISSLLEYVARGMLGGYPVRAEKEAVAKKDYNASKPEDLLEAWDDGMRELIYGDLLDELFKKTAATGKLEDHSSLVQAAHEYILLNIASLLHHIFIMSPDGQYLLRLVENVHRLIPYYVVKQTLRVGNAATMINGMVRLVLAKLSVTAVTNWIGLTNNTNDGMNLMQQIISTVMAWDTSEFQRRAKQVESSRDAPKKEALNAIKSHVYASRDTHDAARNISIQESKSIIAVILESANPPVKAESLTEHQHGIALEFYSTYQSIRDREELTKILCKMQPDLLTSAIRDLVSAFDPVIRAVHNAVDLSGTVADAESFLNDLIKVSKPKKGNGDRSRAGSTANSRSSSPARPAPASMDTGPTSADSVPTVEDYVQLLRKHMPSTHKFVHQVCKNAPDLASQYRTYAHSVLAELRVTAAAKTAEETGDGGAGNMTRPIRALFASLPAVTQDELRALLDQHETHLHTLKQTSHARLKSIMHSTQPSATATTANGSSKPPPHPHGTTHGPGMYLSRWHSLLDSALITPATLHGPVRHGWEIKGELDGKGLKSDMGGGNGNGGGGAGATHKRVASKDRVQEVAGDGNGDAKERQRETERVEGVCVAFIVVVVVHGWDGWAWKL
ncbi:PX-associated-domain-containing protein [Massariosphaeria phaeospora]|uniref:PX-associated-domain-containing protein n=1 Tax=Massariosphaeria phaeospora TaxID=100035 RepID=A0A7C8HYY9_9PLEO|nr:PX-associated-domain-containing protein [Massariosphaeria phaeospora]